MTAKKSPDQVFMMDLLAIVPYYTAYLSRALLEQGVDLQLGTISYYLDPECYQSRGLQPRPGLLDLVGRMPGLPAAVRKAGKLVETVLNMATLSVRFLFKPPSVLHVQYLPLFCLPLRLDYHFARFVQWRGARFILTVHDLLPHDSGETYRDQFKVLYGCADRLICHSDHIQSRLVEEFALRPDKIDVIPHGPFFYDLPVGDDTAIRAKYGIEADQQIVLWQGIVLPYKGLDLLLDAWQSVERRASNAVLLVVGTGAEDLLNTLRRRASALGLKRVVFDLRFVSSAELVSVYRAASIVVYPYRAITTSGALATGVALGKAIVASDLPVFRELLTDGEDAFLVTPSDATALEESIVQLLTDEAIRSQLEEAVLRKDFGTRSWNAIAEKTASVYEAAKRQPSTRGRGQQ